MNWQSGVTFKSAVYSSLNLMWQVLPYLNVGVEYGYSARENRDGSDFDNYRMALGFHFFQWLAFVLAGLVTRGFSVESIRWNTG